MPLPFNPTMTSRRLKTLADIEKIQADPEASQVYGAAREKVTQKHMQSFMTDMQGGMKTGSWGQAARGATMGLGAALGAESPTAQAVVGLAGDAAAVAGDVVGGYLHGMGQAEQAGTAMTKAGAMAEAGNIQARNSLVNDANSAYGQMNSANAAAGAGMTDAAIGQAGAFESGMAAIGSSGISGSGNMKRNLQYGQDRADAQEQLQFDLMGSQAQGVQDAMVNSFDELSNNKAGAMSDAYGGTLTGLINQDRAITQDYQQKAMELAPTHNDELGAINEGLDALPTEGQVVPHSVDNQRQQTAQQQTAQQQVNRRDAKNDAAAINQWLREATRGGTEWKSKVGKGVEINGNILDIKALSAFINSKDYRK
jgi:hypothetical protein